MQLRSASVKKKLFTISPAAALHKAKVVHSPAPPVREQKDQQLERERKARMADTVEALSQCCASAKAKVQRIRRAIEAAALDYGKFNIHALNLYLKTVDAAYAEYNDFQNRIYLTDPTKRAEFEPQFVDFEELYEFVRIALCDMLQKHEDDQKQIALAAQQQQMLALKPAVVQGPSSSGVTVPPRIPSLLLQQTPLPTFDGRYENWFKFKSMFTDIIDKCVSDSPATKLHYLDKALVGKAQGAIDQQTLNDNNYDGAWRILQERFENLPMVIHGHVTKLLNLKPMAKETFQELKTLVDDCEKRVDSLEFHKLKMDKMGEAIVITLLTSKLDPETRKCWENTIEHGKMPVYKEMIAFLRKRSYVLERCEQTASTKARTTFPAAKLVPVSTKTHSVVVQRSEDSCPVCEASHVVEKCEVFRKLNVDGRYSKAKQVGLCFACLKRGHRTSNCKANAVCSTCSKKHHVLLHPQERPVSTNPPEAPTAEDKPGGGSSGQPLTAAKVVVPDAPRPAAKQVLLATAVVEMIDSCGEAHKCRALLDSGAMANFVSERMVNLLRLPKKTVDIPVVGVNGMKSTVKFKVRAVVKSRTTTFEFGLDYLIVPRVTGALPNAKIDVRSWPIPEDIQLADGKFNEPSRIDMLIGAEIFYELLQSGKIKMSGDLPLLQESLLGWLVAGPVGAASSTCCTVRVCQVARCAKPEEDLNELLKRFWKVDEQLVDVESTAADDGCEEHFAKTHSRTEDGRYVVKLPFRSNVTELGESRKQAERRFELLERRFEKNEEMKRMYGEFIDEYLALGHCKEVESGAADAYFLPHHCVLKPDSSSTKLRVVFDASAKSETGLSLNDVMKIGPTVQSSLFEIILRFRTYRYTFTADVPKMYRQILVDSSHTKFQRILWRDDRSKPLKELELKTVTYGTAAAPFLATRSLNQLADDEKHDFPAASKVVRKSFYIDDVLSGADSLDEAKALQKDLIALLERGGFSLHKWCANDPALLEEIPQEAQEKQLKFEDCDVNGTIKTLGLYWDPTGDEFLFRVNPMNDTLTRPTKRQVLSETAKIFDPLGLLAPTVLLPKMIMQRLWQDKVEWDEQIPQELLRTWNQFRSELCDVSAMKIDRRITTNEAVRSELHGFADASARAYGCCIYLRNVKADGTADVKLICGKSRVAPMKELQRDEKPDAEPAQMTIPRLELCAALLLAQQMKAVREALDYSPDQVTLWSDSRIVLSWLQRLKSDTSVFVRNHVSKINNLNPDVTWRHVSTSANPADVVSRGLFPKQLMTCRLWWSGPEFLWTDNLERTFSAESDADEVQVQDETVAVASLVVQEKPKLKPTYETILAGSNFRRLQRIFGYVSRFIFNCRTKKADRRTGEGLTNQDLEDGLLNMVVCVQRVVYAEEIDCLLKDKPIKGKLKNLNPVLDGKALRVGGRIRHSDLPKNQKHPLILPENNHFTELLVTRIHREHLHVGANSLLAVIRQRYWPVNVKRTIHRVLKKCVACFRMKPKTLEQYMGDLPSARVTAAEPFTQTGVDYAGPFFIKQGQGKAKLKAYVCLFVCMSTKAIHLELVTSLTIDGFLKALLRFVGRRGNVSRLFSDNGTNFTGAYKELEVLRKLFNSQMFEDRMANFCQERGIEWRFIAPRAPHQGGLWEANVKCMKTHLCKSFGEAYFTYEEFNTVLVQIESILNSRPLIPMTDDPFDYEALSPGHFLIGRELTSIAEPFYDGLKEGTLSRYQLIQKRKQSFWRRWSDEYITTLQKRSKWTKEPALLRNGLMVVLKEDNVPPQAWKLGRIVETHPGKDGVTRVVTVRTSSGTYRRPTTKIAVLPIDDNQ